MTTTPQPGPADVFTIDAERADAELSDVYPLVYAASTSPAAEQVLDYLRTVSDDLDADAPDPAGDELPDTDIRGAMADELQRMGIMPEPDIGR